MDNISNIWSFHHWPNSLIDFSIELDTMRGHLNKTARMLESCSNISLIFFSSLFFGLFLLLFSSIQAHLLHTQTKKKNVKSCFVIPSIHSYNKIYFDINFMMENTLCVVCFVCVSGWQNLYLIKLKYSIICSIFVFGCCTREKSSERHLGKLKSINVEKHSLESMWMISQIVIVCIS